MFHRILVAALFICAMLRSSAQVFEATDTAQVAVLLRTAKEQQNEGALDSALVLVERAERLCRSALGSAQGAERRSWSLQLLTAQRNRGALLFFQNRYPESITAIQGYLSTAEELKLPEEIGAAYNYLGYCYTAMEDLPTALSWSRKAMVTMRGIGGGIDLANAYTGLGNILDELGQHDSAMFYMRKSLALHRTLDRPNNHAATLFSAIEILRHMDRPDSLDAYLTQAEVLVSRLDQPRSTMNYLNLLGQRRVQQGRSREAIDHLLHADSLAISLEDHRSRHFINRALALAYASEGERREAVQRSELSDAELKEDMGLEKVRAVSAAQAKAEQEKQRATAAADAAAYRKGRWLAWTMAGAGAAIALLLAVLYRQGRRSARRLAQAQQELMRVEKQREAERVRMNVSRDIHDELGGSLSKIALLSDLVADGMDTGRRERLQAIAAHARQVRGSLNDVVWAADPSSDRCSALLEHVADRAHRLLDGTGVELVLDLHADEPTMVLGPAFKRDLSMVVKEALNNALKHGAPRSIRVDLRLGLERFDLSVSDDGRGLGHGPADGGHGLVNMRERIEAHGGTFHIGSGPEGNGALVSAHGPLDAP